MRLWWRDDDAAADDPKLDRLLAIASGHAVPIVLAVIPARLDRRTLDKILACPFASVVQHGLAHADHRSAAGRKCELVDRLDQDDALQAARLRLAGLFGARFLPVMVPPWNRIEPGLRARLPDLGFSGLSTFAKKRADPAVPGLSQRDTHVDTVLWKDGRRHLTASAIVEAVGQASVATMDPVGLLTHHGVTRADGFHALDRAIGLLQDRGDTQFCSGVELFSRQESL